MEYKVLNNGLKMPMVGLGVYNISERETQRVVEDAISVGYRSIDTAAMYYNEKGVGDAVRVCGVPREELFITTKICDSCYTKDETLRTVDHSMKQLGLDYVDLMLIHWPVGNPTVMWHTLEELYEQGLFKAIGVSNFYPNTFPKIVDDAKVIPVVNQCETHVLYQQRKMLEYLKPYDTVLEAWSPLAEGRNSIFKNKSLLRIGEKYGKTSAQVALKFLIQNDIIIIPKTTHKERMMENINVFDFMLTDDDLQEIRLLDTGRNVTGWPSDALKYNPDGKKRLTDVIQQKGVESLAKAIPNNQATAFLDWFTYSDNTIDGRSKKKAYTFIESNLVADKDVGTVKALQQIHAYLFGGLYDYAGRIRTKTIAKGNTLFCLAEHLHSYLKTVETMPENTFDEIVDKYVEMNAAHPFMEGNGRSTRIWLDLIFKKRLNLCVDWSQINKREYLDAMIASHTDSSRIHELLKGALTDKIDDREIFMKGIDYSYYYEQEE